MPYYLFILEKHRSLNSSSVIFSRTDEMLKDYKTGGSAPWFFLLDQHHFVRKVFYGYGEGTTDKEIHDAIQEMIN